MKARDPTPNQEPRRRTIPLQPHINAFLRVTLQSSNQPRNQPRKLIPRRNRRLHARISGALIFKRSRIIKRSQRAPNLVDAALAGVARRPAFPSAARQRRARLQRGGVDVRRGARHRPAQLLGRQLRRHVRGDEGVEARLQALRLRVEGALAGVLRGEERGGVGARRGALLRGLLREGGGAGGECGVEGVGVGEGGALFVDLLG